MQRIHNIYTVGNRILVMEFQKNRRGVGTNMNETFSADHSG